MGGGGSKSETISKAVVDIVTNVCMKQTMDCVQSTTSTQEIVTGDVIGSTIGKISANQKLVIQMKCKSDTETVLKMQEAITNELKQEAKQTSQSIFSALNALAGEKNKTSLSSYIESNVKKTITNEFLTKVTSIVNQTQSIKLGNVINSSIEEITAETTANVVYEAFSSVLSTTDSITEIKTLDEKKSDQKQENAIAGVIDSVSGLVRNALDGASSLLGTLNIYVFIVAIVVCVLVYMFKDVIISFIPFPIFRAAIEKSAKKKLNVQEDVTVNAQPVKEFNEPILQENRNVVQSINAQSSNPPPPIPPRKQIPNTTPNTSNLDAQEIQ